MTPVQREIQKGLNVLVIDHPLVRSLLSILRDARTENASFRAALRELTTMLIYEASRNLATHEVPIETPVLQLSRSACQIRRCWCRYCGQVWEWPRRRRLCSLNRRWGLWDFT